MARLPARAIHHYRKERIWSANTPSISGDSSPRKDCSKSAPTPKTPRRKRPMIAVISEPWLADSTTQA
jgi:hypothetical protein